MQTLPSHEIVKIPNLCILQPVSDNDWKSENHFRFDNSLHEFLRVQNTGFLLVSISKNVGTEMASTCKCFGNRWCKREYVEPDALKEWKVSIFKIVDQCIKFYSQNTNLLPPKPKSTFRHLKQGIQDFHKKYVLVPADKAANNVVVV